VLQAAQTLDETSWVLLLQKNLHKLLGVLGQLRACRFSKLITQAVQEHDRLIQHCTSQLDALLKRFQSRANALQWHETRMKLKPRAAA